MENSLEITKKLKNTITDSFQAKIGWKFQPGALYKIPKKFKNTIMDSFQAKIGWRRMRKRENKNYSSIMFLCNA